MGISLPAMRLHRMPSMTIITIDIIVVIIITIVITIIIIIIIINNIIIIMMMMIIIIFSPDSLGCGASCDPSDILPSVRHASTSVEQHELNTAAAAVVQTGCVMMFTDHMTDLDDMAHNNRCIMMTHKDMEQRTQGLYDAQHVSQARHLQDGCNAVRINSNK